MGEKQQPGAGNPKRYDHIINALTEDQLYSPASIANFAKAEDLINPKVASLEKMEMYRLRILLSRLARKHRFPDSGDGVIDDEFKIPGWFGWRWKRALNHRENGDN